MLKTKLLFIITQAELGGAQRWVFDVATNLDKNRYEITVAAGDNGPLLDQARSYKLKAISLRHLVRNINPLKDSLAILEIYSLIKKEQPDILQLCSTKAGFVGALAGKLAGAKKIVYRIGGWSFNDPRPAWQNKIFLWLEKLSAPLKSIIIVNSQHDFDQALRLKICSQEKLRLLYNGIDINKIQDSRQRRGSPEAARFTIHDSRFRFQNNRTTIGAIANFYPTKGLKYLIEAAYFLKNKDVHFQIIGDGPQRIELENLISKFNLNNVELLGTQLHPEKFFSQWNALVIPSVKEGMPYVLLEALADGLPVIATTVGGVPEIINDKENGLLIPPANTTALVRAIELLTNNKPLQEKIAAQALVTVKNFDLKKMLETLDRIYQNS